MATDVAGLFGINPQQYQQGLGIQDLKVGAELGQMSPDAFGRSMLYAGGAGIGRGIGGALGGEDPQLKIISLRNQIAKNMNPNDLNSVQQAAQALASAGDQQGALQLSDYLRKAQGDYALIQQRTAEKMTPEQRNAEAKAGLMDVISQLENMPASPERDRALTMRKNQLTLLTAGKPEKVADVIQVSKEIGILTEALTKTQEGTPEYNNIKAQINRLEKTEKTPPSMVGEYQFAKSPEGGGFKGTYQEFVRARALASRPPGQPRAEQPPVAVVDPNTNKVIFVDRATAIANKMTPASAMEGLSPKEIQSREAKFPQAKTAVASFETSAEKLAKDLETLANSKGLEGITGLIGGRTPAITKEARAAEALYNSIVARGGFNELQNIRNSSPTGGALGNVSNTEGQNLRDAFAPLKLTQNASDLKGQLLKAAQETRASVGRIKETFDMTYEYKNQGGQTPTPSRTPSPSATPMSADDLVNKYLNK